ncbi:hypothetical protein JCM24511_04154 [Saitozyma sp. JCM 24511]|nr:hypothetical protein JCM24511_04154 [Saitozyma sp. JCM 24511]
MTLPPLERYVAIDCETVRVRSGQVLAKAWEVDELDGDPTSSPRQFPPYSSVWWSPSLTPLCRVGIVDHAGTVLLESFVFVHPLNIVDWLTGSTYPRPCSRVDDKVLTSGLVTGIRPGDLDGAPTFETIQPKIKALLKGKIVVGHALWNDLAIVKHRHPYEDMRDTSLYHPLRRLVSVEREGDQPSLKRVTKAVLGKDVQEGYHCPVEDARSTMAVFMHVREQYELDLLQGKECVAGLPRSFAQWYW